MRDLGSRNCVIGLLTLGLAQAPLPAGEPRPGLALPATGLSEDERIVHALNRLGYGPRPGEVKRVRRMGLATWIERQLAPESISDRHVERRLRAYPTLQMDQAELIVGYPPPVVLRALGDRLTRRMGIGEEEVQAMFPELARFERAREIREKGLSPASDAAMRREGTRRLLEGPGRIVAELAQAKLIRATYSERQLQEVMTDFWFNHFNVFIGKGADRWLTTGYERDAIRPHALGRFRDLLGATAEHPAMLFYLDNWLNSSPGARFDGHDLAVYNDRAIRRQGLPPGGVATLILRERGMDTRQIERGLARRQEQRARRGIGAGTAADGDAEDGPSRNGLNENYARELLELHTLGADGGFTQRDVVEVARCFTGWTLVQVHAGQRFVYVPELHDGGDKIVLGRRIEAGGRAEGEAVLDLLAEHPSTARFVSTKLARRFVADDPPPALVERMARTFRDRDGDIRAVLRTLFASEEFWAPAAQRAKVKTPFEFVVGALRATHAEIEPLPAAARFDAGDVTPMDGEASLDRAAPGLLGALRQLGMPPYAAEPPTGYADAAADWVSTGALLNRMKLSIGLAADRIAGVRVDPPALATRRRVTARGLERLGRELMGRAPSPATVEAIARQLEWVPDRADGRRLPPRFGHSPEGRWRLAVGWLLASPDFQRR